MASGVRERVRQEIFRQDKRALTTRQTTHWRVGPVERLFEPVCQAAEEIREELEGVPSLTFAINPTSVWITLFDREVRIVYDTAADKFVSEESGHNWYDGETYSDLRSWDTVDDCIDAMIRIAAGFARMARAIQSARSAA